MSSFSPFICSKYSQPKLTNHIGISDEYKHETPNAACMNVDLEITLYYYHCSNKILRIFD